jgi:Zn-dependent protease
MLLDAPTNQLGAAVIAYCIVVLLCFPLHEFGHAWVATRLGDTLAEREGRVTLNPMAHLDLLGALVLAVAPFGWAKPVPFYPNNLRRAPSISIGIILVSIAGIVMNLLLATIAAVPLRLNLVRQPDIFYILFLIVEINLSLAVFNLLPIPPLDGSKILAELLPYQYRGVIDVLERYGIFIMLLLIFPIPGVGSLVGVLVSPIVSALSHLMLGF